MTQLVGDRIKLECKTLGSIMHSLNIPYCRRLFLLVDPLHSKDRNSLMKNRLLKIKVTLKDFMNILIMILFPYVIFVGL